MGCQVVDHVANRWVRLAKCTPGCDQYPPLTHKDSRLDDHPIIEAATYEVSNESHDTPPTEVGGFFRQGGHSPQSYWEVSRSLWLPGSFEEHRSQFDLTLCSLALHKDINQMITPSVRGLLPYRDRVALFCLRKSWLLIKGKTPASYTLYYIKSLNSYGVQWFLHPPER
jgi:hypothetical protein